MLSAVIKSRELHWAHFRKSTWLFPLTSTFYQSALSKISLLHNLSGDALTELLRPSGRLRVPLVVPTRDVSIVPLSQASPNATGEWSGHRQSLAAPDRRKRLARKRFLQTLGHASLGNTC